MKVFSLIVQCLLMLATIIIAAISAADREVALTILYCYLSWVLRCSKEEYINDKTD